MKKFFKILGYTVGGVILLVILVFLLIQTPPGEHFVKNQIVSYLRKKLHTEVSIGHIGLSLPNHIKLEDVYIPDQQKDTILYLHYLALNWKAQALLNNKLSVTDLTIDGLNGNMIRPAQDTAFNYEYIVAAFAGSGEEQTQTTEEEDTSSSNMKIDVQKLVLKNIRFKFYDYAGGTLFGVQLGHALLRPTILDIAKGKYALNELHISSVKSSFISQPSSLPPEPPDTSATAPFQLSINQFNLDTISYVMLSHPDSMYLAANVGQLQGNLESFDLIKEYIKAGNLSGKDIQTAIILGQDILTSQNSATPSSAASEGEEEPNNWQILVGGIALNNVGFNMDDPTAPKQKSGMDYSHLHIKQLFINADSIYYSTDSTALDLKHLALLEKSGLNLMDLRSQITYTNQAAVLKHLYLQTPNTILQNHLAVYYPSLEALSNNLNSVRVNIQLQDSKLGMNDLLLFMPPNQQEQFLPYKNQSLQLIVDARGSMKKLNLRRLYLSGLQGTVVDVNGILNDVGNTDKLNYALQLKQITSTEKDITPFLPDSLKQQFSIPNTINITGKIAGSIEDYYPDVQIKTSDGNAIINGKLLMSPGEGHETYDIAVATQNLNLGKILKQDSVMGRISTTINASGVGLSPETMNTKANVDIQAAQLMGYNYQNISLKADVNHQKADISGHSNDKNLNFYLSGTANLQNKYPAINLNLDLKKADLQALHLYDSTLRLAGLFKADFSSLNPDYPDGTFYWLHPFIDYNHKILHPDSIYVISHPTVDSGQNIELNLAGVLHAVAKGAVPLTKIGEVIEAHINRHYHLSDSLKSPEQYPYNLAVKGKINYQPFLNLLDTNLTKFSTIPFRFGLNTDTLGAQLAFSKLRYGGNTLDSGALKIKGNKNRLKYEFKLTDIQTPMAALWYPSVAGFLRNDSVYAFVDIKDSLRKKQFALGGAYYQNPKEKNGNSYFSLLKGLQLNYNIWSVDPDNKIVLTPKGFYIQNLNLSHAGESISVENQQPNPKAPLDFSIKNFSLSNVTKMLSKDTLLADGLLNTKGTVAFSDDGMSNIQADLTIDSLTALGNPLGSLSANVKTPNQNTFATNLALSGMGNDIKLNGDYYLHPVDHNDFNFDLNIQPFKLESVEGLTFGALKNSSGKLNGNLNIKGTAEKPIIVGQLHTDELATTLSMLNAYFKMPSETIKFSPGIISFNQFHLNDSKGNSAILDGDIKTNDFENYLLNLTFNADHWRALHSKKKDNPEYYGDFVFSANLDIAGTASAPKVEGNIEIHDSTDLHYAMLDNGPGMQDNKGIVKFIDSRDTSTPIEHKQEKKQVRISPATQLNVNVAVDKNATFNVLVDPSSGDELQIKGEASLNAFMNPSGVVGLTGTYQVDDGYYDLNYNMIERKFNIQKGSTITLAGDPMDAVANLTAVYNANIAPYDLVKGVVPPDQLVYYKQRLPFEVLLKIKGKVMQPDISFDIVLPEDKTGVLGSGNVANLIENKLGEIRRNPSELNKQVFAVLILNKFLGNDPFAGSGMSVSQSAKNSVSQFLSDQLNRIAGNLIKGVDLNFGLENKEDYSTGTKRNQTNFNVSASKSLFNDRLKVTIGNDFAISGQDEADKQTSLIPGNIAIDYLFTKDGRYKGGIYRSDELQNLIKGHVIETGLKFNVNLSYDKLREILTSRKKYKEWLAAHNKEKLKDKANANSSNKQKGD